MNFDTSYKTLKYFFAMILIFAILKYTIKNGMSSSDIGLISIMVTLVYIVVDNSHVLVKEKKPESEKCESFCAANEYMTNSTVSAKQETVHVTIKPIIKQETMPVAKPIIKQEAVHVHQEQASDYDRVQKRFGEIIEERTQHNSDYITKTDGIDRNDDGTYTMPYKRRSPDIMGQESTNDIKYNITSYHTLPPNVNKGSFEYGYSFLPPANWYPTPPFPPACVAEKQCPVCPVYTSGSTVDLKEWDSSRRISAPDEINVRFVEERLNAGK